MDDGVDLTLDRPKNHELQNLGLAILVEDAQTRRVLESRFLDILGK